MKHKFLNKIVVLSVLLALIFNAMGVQPAQAAGIYTHAEIARQAINNLVTNGGNSELVSLLKRNSGAVYYGAMFPDWGFATDKMGFGNYEAYAEITHDTDALINGRYPEFRAALTANLLTAYRKNPRSQEDEKAIAFLFGLISHQEADMPWHFDETDGEIIIRAFENEAIVQDKVGPLDISSICLPFNIWCTPAIYVSAANWVELGVDHFIIRESYKEIGDWIFIYEEFANCIVSKEGDISKPSTYPPECGDIPTPPETNVNWYIPKEAVVAAYEKGSHDAPAGMLEAAQNAQKKFYDLEPWIPSLDNLPWAYRNMQTYDLGGINDGAEHTIEAWKWTWNWLNSYTPVTKKELLPAQPDGNNTWYRSQPITITLSATDNFNKVIDTGPFDTKYSIDGNTYQDYTTPVTISEEGVHQVSYYSVDSMGISETVNDLTIKIDTTSPVVKMWTDQSQYTRVEPFVVHFSGSDMVSGMASLTAEFNGQPVTNGQTIDLLNLPLGSYTLTVHGEDLAGNVTEQGQSIELYATLDGLQETVNRLCQENFVTKTGICNQLSAKLNAAFVAMDERGNLKVAANVLKAFQNAVKAQTGKSITDNAAWLLLMDSDYMMRDLSR